jgi:predicted HTH domain antitoxin
MSTEAKPMILNIQVPKEAEEALRAEWGDLDLAAKDALLIESYRTGKISVGFLAQVLGQSRWDAERWLAQRGVNWNYGLDDLEADRATIARLDAGKP